ncbi:hypothetical protein PG994_004379 [Apiospora phragmitis]|uniref:Transmembrane protein n=1 Tax=Apiospora phragmitis TaxID=2905665 RepID=A0ABR1VQF3_9PEZI
MAPSDLPPSLTSRHLAYEIYFEPEPRYAKVSGIVVSVLASSACASFFLFRVAQVKIWRSLAWTHWRKSTWPPNTPWRMEKTWAENKRMLKGVFDVSPVLLAIYFDSYLFVMASTILHYNFSVNDYHSLCEAATLLCLLAYLSSKVRKLTYGFFEEQHTDFSFVTGFAVFGCWIILIIFRFSRMENGLCIIGIQRSAMIGPVAVDVVCNAYLTAVFTFPIYRGFDLLTRLAAVYAYLWAYLLTGTRERNEKLLRVAKKSFVGCCLALSSSIANLLALMLLDGEPTWLCLLCCKIDVLFNAVVLFWVTRTDSRDINTTSSRSKSDSARSRVARLSFYTGWLRANMGQGPHPGRPFIIPQEEVPPSPLMGGGADGAVGRVNGGDNMKNSESGGGSTPFKKNNKGDNKRASINTTPTTTAVAAAAAESSQSTKAPTKLILKPSSTGNNIDTAVTAQFACESSIGEIWTGPGGHATESAELGDSETNSEEKNEEQQQQKTSPAARKECVEEKAAQTTTPTSDMGR